VIGVPARVAVHAGASTVRLAAAERGAQAQLLAEVPARGDGLGQVRALIAALVGGPPDELVVVGGPVPEQGWVPLARVVRAVPAAVAAGCGPGLVVDAGHSGTELTVLDRDGAVVDVRRCGVGGARLDGVVAGLLSGAGRTQLRSAPVDEAVGGDAFAGGAFAGDAFAGDAFAGDVAVPATARRVRETLSLLPAATVCAVAGGAVTVTAEQACAVLAPVLAEIVALAQDIARERVSPLPVLLVGGAARTPLLAELFDAAQLGPVTVAARPEAAAVLGALRLPPAALLPVVDSTNAAFRRAPAATVGDGPEPPWHQLAPTRRRPVARVAPAVLAVAVAVAAVGTVARRPSASAAPDVGAAVVAQYGYALRLPEGWAHTGGLPERRRILLTPAHAPEGSDVVAVERTALGYDAAAEPGRAVGELRAVFDSAIATGAPLSGFEPAARFAQRPVVTYREQGAGGAVDWYVLFDGTEQLTVGCRHTAAGAAAVRQACAVVVGSVGRTVHDR